jgi:hypothetical protein
MNFNQSTHANNAFSCPDGSAVGAGNCRRKQAPLEFSLEELQAPLEDPNILSGMKSLVALRLGKRTVPELEGRTPAGLRSRCRSVHYSGRNAGPVLHPTRAGSAGTPECPRPAPTTCRAASGVLPRPLRIQHRFPERDEVTRRRTAAFLGLPAVLKFRQSAQIPGHLPLPPRDCGGAHQRKM